jgi:hypothetical protein
MRTYLHRLADALKTPEGVGFHRVFWLRPEQMIPERAEMTRDFVRLAVETEFADWGVTPEDIRWAEELYPKGEMDPYTVIVADAAFPEFPGVRWIGKGRK